MAEDDPDRVCETCSRYARCERLGELSKRVSRVDEAPNTLKAIPQRPFPAFRLSGQTI